MKNSAIGLEVYVGKHTTRFLTLTGEAINDFDVNDCSEALQELLDTCMLRPIAEEPPVEARGVSCLMNLVMAKPLSANHTENTKILWKGQIPEGKSHSEADMLLCMILAFWCEGDAEQMHRLYRQSELMRHKWGERHRGYTYGKLIIEKKNDAKTVSQQMFKVV